MIKVLVVDDHELVRMGITRMLADVSDIQVLGDVGSGEEALVAVRELRPDVVLMDLRMPGIGGLEATRKLVQHYPEIKVIAVTICHEDPFPTRLLQAGASGYLTKGSCIDEVIKAIRQVYAGQRFLSSEIAQQLALKPYGAESGRSPFDLLSEREMQVALMIVACHSIQDISDRLFLSPKTINTYRYRIFEKLSVGSDVELALLAVRHGVAEVQPS